MQIKENAAKRADQLTENEASNKRVVLFFHDLCRYLSLLLFFQLGNCVMITFKTLICAGTALYCGPNGNTAMYDILSAYQGNKSRITNMC